jgi:hypothetical protein
MSGHGRSSKINFSHPSPAVVFAVLPFIAVTPALAAGSNTTNPAAVPATPAPVVTSQPQLSTVGAGGCAWQYTKAINSLGQQAIIANDVGLAANAVGAAAEVTGLIAQEAASIADAAAFTALAAALAADIPVVGTATPGAIPAGVLAGSSVAKSIAYGAEIVGAGSTVTGVASQIAAQVFTHQQADLNTYVTENLPLCDTTFTGK